MTKLINYGGVYVSSRAIPAQVLKVLRQFQRACPNGLNALLYIWVGHDLAVVRLSRGFEFRKVAKVFGFIDRLFLIVVVPAKVLVGGDGCLTLEARKT